MTATMTRIVFIALLAIVAVGCKQANDERVPAFPVRMEFNQQVWGIYGVHTYGEHRIFDRSRGLPSGYYNYDPDALTGWGGVLLVSGYNFETGDYNMPLAYDLACPVEADRNKGLLSFDEEMLEAYCPNCESRFDVCEGAGIPTAGPAAQSGYSLRRYRVIEMSSGGYMVTN